MPSDSDFPHHDQKKRVRDQHNTLLFTWTCSMLMCQLIFLARFVSIKPCVIMLHCNGDYIINVWLTLPYHKIQSLPDQAVTRQFEELSCRNGEIRSVKKNIDSAAAFWKLGPWNFWIGSIFQFVFKFPCKTRTRRSNAQRFFDLHHSNQ